MEACIVWGSVVCKDFQLNSTWNKCIFIWFKYITFLDFIYLFYIKVSCNMTLSYMNFLKKIFFFSFFSALPLSFVTFRKQLFCSIYLSIPHVVRELYVIIVCLNLFIFSSKHDFFPHIDIVCGFVTNDVGGGLQKLQKIPVKLLFSVQSWLSLTIKIQS